MISKAIRENNIIEVYDEKNNKVSTQEALNKEIAGVAANFYVVYNDSNIEVYNPESMLLSFMSKEGKVVTGTIAETFTVKNDVYIESYDENCNLKHINNIVSAAQKITQRELQEMKISLLREQERFQELKTTLFRLEQYEALIKFKDIGTKLGEITEFIENTIK